MSLTNGSDVIEGTWDEVVAHAARFVGQRVRVTILTAPIVTPIPEHAHLIGVRRPHVHEQPAFERGRVPIYD